MEFKIVDSRPFHSETKNKHGTTYTVRCEDSAEISFVEVDVENDNGSLPVESDFSSSALTEAYAAFVRYYMEWMDIGTIREFFEKRKEKLLKKTNGILPQGRKIAFRWLEENATLAEAQKEFASEMVRDASRQERRYTHSEGILNKPGDTQYGVEFDEVVDEAFVAPLKLQQYSGSPSSFAEYIDNRFIDEVLKKLYKYAKAKVFEENCTKAAAVTEEQIFQYMELIVSEEPKMRLRKIVDEIDYENLYVASISELLRMTARNLLSREYNYGKKEYDAIVSDLDDEENAENSNDKFFVDYISPLDVILTNETFQEIFSKIRSYGKTDDVKDKLERIFVLKYLGDNTRKEISDIIGISESMISRYTKVIKEILASLGLRPETTAERKARKKRNAAHKAAKKQRELEEKRRKEQEEDFL